ncbi:unnamed protein product [Rotaria socialis]|uniref:Uncharacterized protein n=2 Tax=Rotaria socialis TaxID=392032 RepID=A0A820Q9E0_9BILA|nr:unnamed protein product [Rotaria socialis]CAF3504171.1 unnamed protein product [Rotaria socialis]CAF4418998.1 unnamed protein product [Rotaria socialis]CAF4701921.1 unnamed protein product [Rotaria socialis]
MSILSNTLVNDDNYCQICTCTSIVTGKKRLSCFVCDHCRLSMCYECFNKHTTQLVDEYSQIQKRYSKLDELFNQKRQLLQTFEEHCIRSVNSAFDEIVNDLQILRKEGIDYVKQQFNDSQIVISEMITNIKSFIDKSQHHWTHDGITKNAIIELDDQRKQMNEIEQRFGAFALPNMQLKVSTYPRNQLDLDCQLSFNLNAVTKKFLPSYPGKVISTKCLCSQQNEYENEKFDVDTEVEELQQTFYSTKEMQTDAISEPARTKCKDYIDDNVGDEDEYFSLKDEIGELINSTNTEHSLSKHYISQSIILTQNEVDRIASDDEHLLYFSDVSKSLCYVRNISLGGKRANGTSQTTEVTCRWPHSPILDLVYSPASSQFVCATKTGVYTCTVDSDHDDSTIDIQLQLAQSWSYIRLSADKNLLWIWADAPQLSQLLIYSPKSFECIKVFNLIDYPRFSDNSTSFCIHSDIIATVFQYKQTKNTTTYKKNFHVTFCDSSDLHELCTIDLGECDFDHEIRANNNGIFFVTNGKGRLWIVDRYGEKEYVKLFRTGRALTVHATNQILIANGTKQLQRIELLQKDNKDK